MNKGDGVNKMIFLGKSIKPNVKFFIRFRSGIRLVSKIDYIPHYWLIFAFGHHRYWIGYNRLKRIIRGKLYEIDGKKIKYPIKL